MNPTPALAIVARFFSLPLEICDPRRRSIGNRAPVVTGVRTGNYVSAGPIEREAVDRRKMSQSSRVKIEPFVQR